MQIISRIADEAFTCSWPKTVKTPLGAVLANAIVISILVKIVAALNAFTGPSTNFRKREFARRTVGFRWTLTGFTVGVTRLTYTSNIVHAIATVVFAQSIL